MKWHRIKSHSNIQKQQKEKVNALPSQEFVEQTTRSAKEKCPIFLERLKDQNKKLGYRMFT